MSVARRSVLAAAWSLPVISVAVASPAAAASAEEPLNMRSVGISVYGGRGIPVNAIVTITNTQGIGLANQPFELQVRSDPTVDSWVAIPNWMFVSTPGPFGGSVGFRTLAGGQAPLAFSGPRAPAYPGVNGRISAVVDGVLMVSYFPPAPV